MGRLNPPQMLILSFFSAICLGTIALSLPIATYAKGGMPFVDSLFTATSATCVTGLIIRDTGAYFTPFGRWVIFALFQAGGLGIMTFSTLFAVMLGRKIGIRQGEVIRSALSKDNILGFKKLIGYILGITFAIEGLGALFLFLRWKATMGWPVLKTLEAAVFHSVSGFCNAGLSLFRMNFTQFEADPVINITMMMLIITGGIGFVVIMDVLGLFFKKGVARRLSLQTKIALFTSFILIVAGTLILLVVEKDNVMKGMGAGERLLGALFQSVTARTAGFNTLPIGKLAVPSLMFLVFLMFVGASPGSTGGGIKTCTFAVLLVTVKNMFLNRRRVVAFGRSIPRQVVKESIIIFFLSASWVFVFTMLLAFPNGNKGAGGFSFMQSLFEVTSAFGTVGLSTGITEDLDTIGKVLITATMFAGRVGPLTLALAVAFRERVDRYLLPEENLMVG